MSGQKDNVIPIGESKGSGGNGGDGEIRELYRRVGNLEGELSHLATKEDVQKMKTDIEKEIGNSKEWILHRVLIVIAGVFVLVILNSLIKKLLS